MIPRIFRAIHLGENLRRSRFILFAILIAGLAVALVVVGQLQDRARRLDAARHEAATLARALEEQTASVLWASDFALRGLVEAIEEDPAIAEHQPALEAWMRRQIGQLPGVRALFVIGPDGFIIQDSDRDTPRRNLRDRDYFRAHSGGPNPNLFVGQPLQSRSVDSWFVGLSRRIQGPRGEFLGVAVAALETSYFETLYADLDLGPGHTIMLATRNGILVSRTPALAGQVGRPLSPDAVGPRLAQAMARPSNGHAVTAGTFDEPERIIGYRPLRQHPLVVVVALSKSEVLQPWWRGAVSIAALAVVAVGLSFLILWLAMRHARREEEVRARIAQATKLEAIGRVTSGVAHDFNNILQVLGATLAGLRRINKDAMAAEVIDMGLDSIQRGRGVVGQLLTVARPKPLDLQRVDVSARIRDMKSLLTSAGGGRIRIEIDLADGLPPCRTDPSRLESAVLNLIVNARDAAVPGKTGHVRIVTERADGASGPAAVEAGAASGLVCISVSDDGVGMTDEVRRQVLEPFFTTKGDAGTGLGLAQVDMFMRETGGRLQIQSRPGVGTTVQLLLPCDAPGAGHTGSS